MALVMGVYKPQVLCRGLFPAQASCGDIIYGMPASTTAQVFGPQSDPAASVKVPHTLGSGESLGMLFRGKLLHPSDSWIRR